MSQQHQSEFQGNYHTKLMNIDTTYTKIFVGGLAWETQRDTMEKYFEQFGEILEAAVISDKSTGRSKGYGFVTFKDADAAFRACQNPSPVIDGRRANCNLASLGSHKNRSPTLQHGAGKFRAVPVGLMSTPVYPGSSSSTFFHQPSAHPPYPYSTYGYSGYSHDTMYPMNYYGQQFSPYYPASGGGTTELATGTVGYFHNMVPYYGGAYESYAQSNQAHNFGVQYPQMVQQYPFIPHHQFTSGGILSLPTSPVPMPMPSTATTAVTRTYLVAQENVLNPELGQNSQT